MKSPGRTLRGWLPGIAQFRGYQAGWLRGDVLAGMTVATYLVPQVMAYAQVAGLPPVAGLWAILGPLAAYALFGPSRQLSVGPESSTALMTATMLAPLAAGDAVRYATLAAALALLVGVLCLLGWLARFGVLAELLSKPVLVGYLAGIAIIMVIGQLGRISGVPASGGEPLGELLDFLHNAGTLHWPTLALAAGVLVLIELGERLAPKLPSPLLVITLASALVAVFGWRTHGIAVIGSVPAGLPEPAVPAAAWHDLGDLLLPAFGIMIIGFSDNVLTSRAFAGKRAELVDANQELRALGLANIASGLLRGFPVSSSGSRTAIADSVGARTQGYSLVALALVIVVLVSAGPLLATIPDAALGAVVIYAATRLVGLREFQRIARFRRSELVLAVATVVAVLGLGVLGGVLVAVGLCIMDLLRKLAHPHDGVLGYVPGLAGMHDVDDYPKATPIPGLLVYRYDAPLCFANADDFYQRALGALDAADAQPQWLLLNAEANVELDITAADALHRLREALRSRGVVLAMARVKQDLLADLRAAGISTEIGEDRIYPTLPIAVEAFQRWKQESPAT